MTILFFTRLFYPYVGGVEKHVYNVSQELVKRGYDVIVVTERYNTQLKKKDVYNGITIHRIPIKENWFKKFYIWSYLFKHKKLLQKADIVHCHDIFYWFMPFKLIYPGKKVYTTFHGYEGNNLPSFKAKIAHKLAEKLSNGNICIGNFYQKWYGTQPTFVSYGAVNSTNLKRGKTNNKLTQAVFIGRLEEETGIMVYLRAISLLKNKKISLKVLGDGALRKRAEEFVKKNKLSVRFLGFVENPQFYVEKADVMFVSRYLAILESLVQKKIVFAVFNNKIKKDYLTNTPFVKFINISSSPKQLANQLNSVLNDKKLFKQNLEQEYLWAKGQTWNKLTNLYLNLWQL